MSDANVVDFDRSAVTVLQELRQSVVAVLSEGGSGSGTVAGDGSLVVTNHHVAQGDRATVVDASGAERQARVVAREPKHDLAVLRLDRGGLRPVAFAPARELRPGQGVFAIGNPWGQQGAITAGIVIATPRPGEVIRANIRLSPGNSGGPLADGRGHVVGINAMIGGGLGMAVPSEAVELLLARAAEEAHTGRPGYLGVAGQILPEGIAAGLPGSVQSGAWLLTAIEPGGPAEQAGLWPGDILLELDGRPPGEHPGKRLRSGHPTRARLLRGRELRDIEIVPGAVTT